MKSVIHIFKRKECEIYKKCYDYLDYHYAITEISMNVIGFVSLFWLFEYKIK